MTDGGTVVGFATAFELLRYELDPIADGAPEDLLLDAIVRARAEVLARTRTCPSGAVTDLAAAAVLRDLGADAARLAR